MSEITLYEAQKKKLEGLCEEHDLTFRFRKEKYPITLTISPLQGVYEQMSMLEEADPATYISPDASMTWFFEDGQLTTKVSGGTFTISRVLRAKIESILLKMISYWQQFFFRDVIEHQSLKQGMMPVINENEADDAVDEDADDDLEDLEEEDDTESGEGDEDDEPEDCEEDDEGGEFDEELVEEAARIVRVENKATVSLLQRRMNLGYSAASRLMDILEGRGVVGQYNGSAPREVLPYDVPEDEE